VAGATSEYQLMDGKSRLSLTRGQEGRWASLFGLFTMATYLSLWGSFGSGIIDFPRASSKHSLESRWPLPERNRYVV
jgi:hypothetical protein